VFVQNFIELSAAVYELSWSQSNNKNSSEIKILSSRQRSVIT